jgi:hypothetical protein
MENQPDSNYPGVAVDLSDDGLSAWIRRSKEGAGWDLSKEEVLAALKEAEIAVDEQVCQKVEAFLPWSEKESDSSERFLIAEGRLPVEGRDADFIIEPSLKGRPTEPDDEDHIDYYAFNTVVAVEAGTRIGRIQPAEPAIGGVDVRGRPISPKRRPREVILDGTVRRAEDDAQCVVAQVAGKVTYKEHTVSITEYVTINGDVDFQCGNIRAATDVSIKGTILDLFKVSSTKSIKVGGAIQAAYVQAGGDVLVRGGILGRNQGSVKAQGQIVAKFADEADLRAGGDVRITREVMNSRIHAEGKLFVSHGAVIGGQVYAREGVEVGAIGSEAGVPTCVTVGIHPGVLDRADAIDEEIKAMLKAIERIRGAVQPLMADLKRLTPEQKERATELLSAADAMVAEIDHAEARRDQMIQEARAKEAPGVVVAKILHAGSRIRIGRRHVVFDDDLKGPVKIEKRKVEGVTEFVAVSRLTGSVTPLKSAYVNAAKAGEGHKILTGTSAADHGSGR